MSSFPNTPYYHYLYSQCPRLFGFGAWFHLSDQLSPLVVGIALLVQPVVAASVGWIVYGERLTMFDFVGAIAIAAALLLVRDSKRSLPSDEMSTGL